MPGPFTKLRSNTKCAFPPKYHHACRNGIYKTSVFGDLNENLKLGSTQKKEKKDDS